MDILEVKYRIWQVFFGYIMKNFLKKHLVSLVSLSLFSCSGVNLKQWQFPYMMEVSQGSYITYKQYNQLYQGMTKDDVVAILGHPLSQYAFNQDRWDFTYQNYSNNKLQQSYFVTLYFNKDAKVDKIVCAGKLFKN